MKALFLFLSLAVLSTTIDARQGGNFGLGAVLGDPTGLSMKYWLRKDNAVSGALAFGTYRHHYYNDHHDGWYDEEVNIHLHANYLWHSFSALPVQRGELPLYWGAGGRLLMGHDFAMGVRGCGGIEYLPLAPIDIFLELGVIIDFVGHVGGDVDLGLGLRYFF